jgi:hypothetical protein
MKLEFRDKLQRDAIDLYFEINDSVQRDITAIEAEIKWSLTLTHQNWGIDSFNYELSLLFLSIKIDTALEDGTIESNTLIAEIKFKAKKSEGDYICRIYEDVLVQGKWEEEEYVQFPIKLIVEEKPATDLDNRSQIYVRYLELDVNSDEKYLKLTI